MTTTTTEREYTAEEIAKFEELYNAFKAIERQIYDAEQAYIYEFDDDEAARIAEEIKKLRKEKDEAWAAAVEFANSVK